MAVHTKWIGRHNRLLTSSEAWLGRNPALYLGIEATLLGYANDTWRSFQELTWPNGLPADCLYHEGNGWSRRLTHTSPTNIGAYLWSIVAAERLNLINPVEAESRLDQTLKTLAGLERTHGRTKGDIG